MLLVPLGINGFFPAHGRHTACYLLAAGGRTAILLDAGTGAARLAEEPVKRRIAGCEELHILLSHYHLDHVSGLFYLAGVWPRKRVIIYAPGHPLVDANAAEAVTRLCGAPYFPRSFAGLPVEVVDVTGAEVMVGGHRVRFRAQRHPGGSVGIRIGDVLCYVTDTAPDPATAAFARGCRLLLHEVWFTDEEMERYGGPHGVAAQSGHSWAGAVAEIAGQAETASLAPIHLAPWRSSVEAASLIAQMEKKTGCLS